MNRLKYDLRGLPLTERQKQVLVYAAGGMRYKQIACATGLAHQTVKNHLTAVREKLEASSTTNAVYIATQKGLI